MQGLSTNLSRPAGQVNTVYRGRRFIQQQPAYPRRGQHTCRAAAEQEPGVVLPEFPYQVGFQCNERLLQWDDSAQRRLIKIYVAQELDTTVEAVDAKLLELSTLLPDLVGKLDRLKATLVLDLVRDTGAVAAKLVALRGLLPSLDLSRVFSQYPHLLLELSQEQVAAQLEALRAALPGVAVERVIEKEPMLLVANIGAVLEEIRRLLPGSDPVLTLLADPTMVLDMKAAGLPASLEIDDGIKA